MNLLQLIMVIMIMLPYDIQTIFILQQNLYMCTFLVSTIVFYLGFVYPYYTRVKVHFFRETHIRTHLILPVFFCLKIVTNGHYF